jgi:hypothetical protein
MQHHTIKNDGAVLVGKGTVWPLPTRTRPVLYTTANTAGVSRKALRDNELTFQQFSFAHKRITQYAISTKWPTTNIAVLCDFFMSIETHYFRELANGKAALLEYQSWVRQEWHRTLELDKAFSIQHINKTILNECKHKADSDAQLAALTMVCHIHSKTKNTTC